MSDETLRGPLPPAAESGSQQPPAAQPPTTPPQEQSSADPNPSNLSVGDTKREVDPKIESDRQKKSIGPKEPQEGSDALVDAAEPEEQKNGFEDHYPGFADEVLNTQLPSSFQDYLETKSSYTETVQTPGRLSKWLDELCAELTRSSYASKNVPANISDIFSKNLDKVVARFVIELIRAATPNTTVTAKHWTPRNSRSTVEQWRAELLDKLAKEPPGHGKTLYVLTPAGVDRRPGQLILKGGAGGDRDRISRALEKAGAIMIEINQVNHPDTLEAILPAGELFLDPFTSSASNKERQRWADKLDEALSANVDQYRTILRNLHQKLSKAGELTPDFEETLKAVVREAGNSESKSRAAIDNYLENGHEINRTVLVITAALPEGEGLDQATFFDFVRSLLPDKPVPSVHLKSISPRKSTAEALSWHELWEMTADDACEALGIRHDPRKGRISLTDELANVDMLREYLTTRHWASWGAVTQRALALLFEPETPANIVLAAFRTTIAAVKAQKSLPEHIAAEILLRFAEVGSGAGPSWQERLRKCFDELRKDDKQLCAAALKHFEAGPVDWSRSARLQLTDAAHPDFSSKQHFQVAVICLFKWAKEEPAALETAVEAIRALLARLRHHMSAKDLYITLISVHECRDWLGRLLLINAVKDWIAQPRANNPGDEQQELALRLMTWALQRDVAWTFAPYPRSLRGNGARRHRQQGTLGDPFLALSSPGELDLIGPSRPLAENALRTLLSIDPRIWLKAARYRSEVSERTAERELSMGLADRYGDLFYATARGVVSDLTGPEAITELADQLQRDTLWELFGRLSPPMQKAMAVLLYRPADSALFDLFTADDHRAVRSVGPLLAKLDEVRHALEEDTEISSLETVAPVEAERAAESIFSVLRLFRAAVIADWRYEAYGISSDGLSEPEKDRIRSFLTLISRLSTDDIRQQLANDWQRLARLCDSFQRSCHSSRRTRAGAGYGLKAERYRLMAEWMTAAP